MDRRSLVIIVFVATAAVLISLALAATRDELAVETAPSTPAAASVSTTGAPVPTSPGSSTSTTAPETTTTTAPGPTLAPGTTACDPYETIGVAGTVASPDLVEASGMAASRTSPGVLWAHNDSRDGARVYALGSDGADLGGFDIAGALAFDWEDMAAGTGR